MLSEKRPIHGGFTILLTDSSSEACERADRKFGLPSIFSARHHPELIKEQEEKPLPLFATKVDKIFNGGGFFYVKFL